MSEWYGSLSYKFITDSTAVLKLYNTQLPLPLVVSPKKVTENLMLNTFVMMHAPRGYLGRFMECVTRDLLRR
jgi:hypothetical protein